MDGSMVPSGLRILSGDSSSEFRFATDRLRRTAVEGFFAQVDFVRRHGLTGDEGMGRAIVPGKEGRGMVTALVAVDALVADKEGTGGVLGITMDGLSHESRIRAAAANLSSWRESEPPRQANPSR